MGIAAAGDTAAPMQPLELGMAHRRAPISKREGSGWQCYHPERSCGHGQALPHSLRDHGWAKRSGYTRTAVVGRLVLP
jgi:hypothetical protein